MKIELPDNAREAFQFLALGAGIVLAIRLVVAAFGLWSGHVNVDPLAEACAPFRNGYPLVGKHTLVVGGLPVIPRLAVAGLFVLLCGAALALLVWPIGKVFKWQGRPTFVMGGRTGLLLGGAWAVYCLLGLPAERAEVRQKEIVLQSRTAFLGVIPWPLPGTEVHLPLVSIDQYFINRHSTDKNMVVAAYIHNEAFLIARAPKGTTYTKAFEEQWGWEADHLVATLRALPR